MALPVASCWWPRLRLRCMHGRDVWCKKNTWTVGTSSRRPTAGPRTHLCTQCSSSYLCATPHWKWVPRSFGQGPTSAWRGLAVMGICLSRFLATRPTSSTFMYMFTRTAVRTCNADFAHLMPHSVGLEAKPGDAVLFDFRVLHRGKPSRKTWIFVLQFELEIEFELGDVSCSSY